MSPGADPAELVRAAAGRALARPGPWVAGVVFGAFASGAGVVAGLLGAVVGYLGTAMATLLFAPEVPALDSGPAPLALPGATGATGTPRPVADAGRGAGERPLPPALRARFQAVHRSVEEMAAHWPPAASADLDRARLTGAAEVFRRRARLLASMSEGDPGAPALARRLDEIEAQVARMRAAWSVMVSAPGEGEDELEDLAVSADQLEALLEAELP